MSLYARPSPETGQPDVRDFASAPPAKGWRPFTIDAQPTPSAVQVVIDAGIVFTPTTARQTWGLRAKTQAEQDAEANAADVAALKAMVASLTTAITTDRSGLTQAQKVALLEQDAVRLSRVARYYLRTLA